MDSNPLLDLVTHAAPLILFELAPDGTVLRSSGAGHAALPRPEGESVGQSIFDLYAHAPAVLEPVRRALGGETFVSTSSVPTPEGTVVFETAYAPVFSADGAVEKVVGVALDVTQRAAAQARAQRTTDELRALAGRLQNERETERKRLARDIHDVLGQALTAIRFEARWIKAQLTSTPDLDKETVVQRVDGLDGLAMSALRTVQSLVDDLRPPDLDTLGLASALEGAARRFSERTGVSTETRISPILGRRGTLSDALTIDLYRIVQEALTNVGRHACASSASIEITVDEPSRTVTAEIRDDGVGIGATTPRRGAVGLVGMRERASSWGGSVDVASTDGGGTSVRAVLPLTDTDQASGE